MSLRSIIAWCLYDFANSAYPTLIITFIFATYFTKQIAPDPITGTHLWGNAISLAGLIIAFLSPLLGSIGDVKGGVKPWLGFFTLLVIISSALLWFATPTSSSITYALSLIVISSVSMELATVFYNAMLSYLAPKKYIGRVSGWAWGLGYFGGLICLGVALFVFYWYHPIDSSIPSRLSGPLVALWLLIFSLPLFLWSPDKKSNNLPISVAVKKGWLLLVHTLKQGRHYPNIFLFLIAHMFYLDGLNTIFSFGGIYAVTIFSMPPSQLIVFGLSMNISAGIGALLLAWVDDFLGSKNTIIISLVSMIFFGICLIFAKTIFVFWFLALGLCFFVGPTQAASRSLLVHIAPKEQITNMFGLYALSGKITAFLSPWLLGLVTFYTKSLKIGMLVPVLFVTLGGILLMLVDV